MNINRTHIRPTHGQLARQRPANPASSSPDRFERSRAVQDQTELLYSNIDCRKGIAASVGVGVVAGLALGGTLIETMIAGSITGILGAIAVPAFLEHQEIKNNPEKYPDLSPLVLGRGPRC